MGKSPKISIKNILLHLGFWVLYLLSEYLANLFHIDSEAKLKRFIQSTLLSLPLLLLPVYLIAGFAVPRFLKKGKTWLFLATITIAMVIVFYGRLRWLELINYLENDHYFKMPTSKVIKNVIRDYAIIALAVCIYIIGDYRKNQKLNEELTKAKAEAEIQLLKGQLQPHFLFNTLNNIYSLALIKSDLTADSILKLTELLDYLVYKANQAKVPLSKEIQLLNNYIDLEKLRYGDKLEVKSTWEVENDAVLVAPLILLPFAENCFKHGGASKNGVFFIETKLKVDAQKLLFTIKNSKKTNQPKNQVNGGVGLKNIRKRLNLLYPDRHQLNIEETESFYKVHLEIEYAAL